MSVDVNKATQDYFKSRRPVQVITCCHPRRKQKCLKYNQPLRPEPCKPDNKYQPCNIPLEANTVHILSYQPFDVNTARACRPDPVVPQQGVIKNSLPLEKDTTFSLSYMWVTQPKGIPCKPQNESVYPKGPLQSVTTHRHDFTAKMSERQENYKPKESLHLIEAKFEDKTIMSESYGRIDKYQPAVSCKPESKYIPPECPLEDKTTQQLSYLPNRVPPKEIFPWTLKPQYKGPECPFIGDTIYSGSFLAPGTFEEIECPPEENERDIICFCSCARATDGL